MHTTLTPTIPIDPELAHSVHSVAAHAPEHTPAACLNCGTPVPDRYCGHCGQDAHHTHRLTMADMLHDIPHSIWHIDKGIIYSLRTIISRPGTTIRAYLAGQRANHFRPLSLLLIVTGAYAFISSILHIDMMPPRDPAVPEEVYQMQKSGMEFMAKYMSWVYVALVPSIAGFARLFLRRGGYNYAECLVIAAFITAICNALTLFSLPIVYLYSGTPHIQMITYAISALSIGFATWAYSTLLTHTGLGLAGRLIRGFFPFVLGIYVPVILGTILMMAVNSGTAKQGVEQPAQAKSAPASPRP